MASDSPEVFQFKEKLASFQAALLERHPRMPILLREIHATLKKQPENVTLLSEEDICSIVQGLEIQTNTFLADSVAKSSKKTVSAAVKAKINVGSI